ncbi:transposase [Rhizobium sp. SEMIA 4085]|uniref:transposase n=1 Tax=Rhizobium sp. SEMIA 4085 TaxID=2137761 RepID=UPI00147867E8|nr:transposase [Rhizobium sp. SEMIA 4085]
MAIPGIGPLSFWALVSTIDVPGRFKKSKAVGTYEFGVKVSVATTLNRSKGGLFVTHIQALPGKPYDGHALETVIPTIEAQLGATLSRIIADAGYKGHNARQATASRSIPQARNAGCHHRPALFAVNGRSLLRIERYKRALLHNSPGCARSTWQSCLRWISC